MSKGKELAQSQIPIEAVSPEQLPRERGLSYDEIARVVGSLYLDSHLRMSTVEGQFKAIIEQLQTRVDQLMAENFSLKKELEKRNAVQTTLGRVSPKSDNSGETLGGGS